MGPPQRRLATGLRRRAEARLGSRLRMARLFPSAPAEVGVEPSPFKRDCGDDLGSVHNVRAISIPCSTMFNNVQIPADLSHPNSERFNVIWPLEKVTRNGETSSSLTGRTSGLPKPSYSIPRRQPSFPSSNHARSFPNQRVFAAAR